MFKWFSQLKRLLELGKLVDSMPPGMGLYRCASNEMLWTCNQHDPDDLVRKEYGDVTFTPEEALKLAQKAYYKRRMQRYKKSGGRTRYG